MKFITSFFLKAVACSFLVLSLSACEKDDDEIVQHDWQLVWQDEFDGLAGDLPDPSKWTYDLGTGTDGWGNQELQYYTDRAENVSLNGEGQLAITARKETFSGAPFTSGRIKTKGLYEPTYGRIEARIQVPYGPGIWPAFWMLGANIDEVPWPQCGEIDILETRGQQPQFINGSLHGPGYSGGNPISATYGLEDERFDTDFHLYAVEWFEDRIDFYMDDVLYQRVAAEDVPGEWVYDHSFFIILNVAVGGNYVGFPTGQTPFPQTMLVDYVRVYQL